MLNVFLQIAAAVESDVICRAIKKVKRIYMEEERDKNKKVLAITTDQCYAISILHITRPHCPSRSPLALDIV